MVFFAILQFEIIFIENLERASVSLFMLSAKQGNHWYHFVNVFGMTRPLAGIEPGTSRTRGEHSAIEASWSLMRAL